MAQRSRSRTVTGIVLLAMLGIASSGCGSGSDAPAAAAPTARPTAPPPPPSGGSSSLPPPGVLSSGAMAARGRGGGGGGRPLGRELFEQNRRERLAREGPQRPLSERHDELQRDGQELAQQLAERLSPAQRAALESRTPAATTDEAVRERCEALLTMNREALSARGESGQTTSQAFLQRCHQFSRETFECADRGEEGRQDPACRTHLQRLDREVGTLRRQGDEVRHPEQRIDGLADEQWETERESFAPASLAAESVLD